MNATSFVLRGLWFYRKSHLGVLAGSALGAMVVLGALMAGDSVKETLRRAAEARLGKVDSVLTGGDRWFRAALADDVTTSGVEAAPVLMIKGTVTVQESGRMLGNVNVLGVDERFWRFGTGGGGYSGPPDRGFAVNEPLARTLNLQTDETLVLRFEKPAVVARDAPLAGKPADLIALRGGVAAICGDADFGRFSLEATQLPQATVFVPIARLQQAVELEGKANLLLLRNHPYLLATVTRCCQLADYGISLEELPPARALEVRTSRIFFDRRMAGVIRQRFPAAQPVITYLANTIAVGGKSTPYSMVTAVDAAAAPFLPTGLHGAILNEWLAADLGAAPGQNVRIDYYTLDAGNRLVERSAVLPVAGVIPLGGLAADRKWMPDFPGVEAAENTADWEPGVPIDLKRIRDKDEAYWDEHRGTPKLFLPLETGRAMFANRWGEFTALRIPVDGTSLSQAAEELLESMTPSDAGLLLRDVRSKGMAAASSPVDFAGLFLGMSVFLIAAAVALTAMLFRFHLELRNRESGLLAALGIPPAMESRWRLMEGCCVVTAGSLAGALLAAGYTRCLLAIPATIWSGPGERMAFQFHAAPVTVTAGLSGFILLTMVVIALMMRKQARRDASLRLEAGTEEIPTTPLGRMPWLALGCGVAGIAAAGSSGVLGSQGSFFLAGCCCLAAGLAAFRHSLRQQAATTGSLSPRRLAALNCGRRPTRSLVVVGSLAAGVFLMVSVAVFRQHGSGDWRNRHSGTGGFEFWVETTSPLHRDESLDAKVPGTVLPFRAGAGDDASCFNLNTVASPRVLATDVTVLDRLGAFPIKNVIPSCANNWNTLRDGPVMRAFVDENTLLWVLKRKLGDRLIYQDEWGADYPVEIAGSLTNTVFQGALVVDQARFLKHHPAAAGPRVFLMESGGEPAATSESLQRMLADRGAMVTTTRERLAAFHRVENTYITVFQLLGGLGVVIASAGLGLLTARNLTDRRYEFAILHTVGVPHGVSRGVVFREVASLIGWGLGIGMAAAAVAILPMLKNGGFGGSLAWLALLVVAIAANAWFWSWLGFRRIIRDTFQALQRFST